MAAAAVTSCLPYHSLTLISTLPLVLDVQLYSGCWSTSKFSPVVLRGDRDTNWLISKWDCSVAFSFADQIFSQNLTWLEPSMTMWCRCCVRPRDAQYQHRMLPAGVTSTLPPMSGMLTCENVFCTLFSDGIVQGEKKHQSESFVLINVDLWMMLLLIDWSLRLFQSERCRLSSSSAASACWVRDLCWTHLLWMAWHPCQYSCWGRTWGLTV